MWFKDKFRISSGLKLDLRFSILEMVRKRFEVKIKILKQPL